MAELDMDIAQSEEAPRPLHFEWFVPMLLKPKKTIEHILRQANGVWLAPLLVLTALALVSVVIAGPIRQSTAQAQAMNSEIPPNFEYMTPEEQAQFQEGMQVSSGPVFTYVLPALSAVAGVWLQWVLLGSLLHLSLTLAGSRGSNASALNLVAWASVPLILRMIVQAVYMLAAHQTINATGLAGFVDAQAGGVQAFLAAVLAQVDGYYLWMVAIILLGVTTMTGLPRSKAWIATILMLLLMLALIALPAFLSASFSGMNSASPIFFF